MPFLNVDRLQTNIFLIYLKNHNIRTGTFIFNISIDPTGVKETYIRASEEFEDGGLLRMDSSNDFSENRIFTNQSILFRDIS